VSAHSTIPAGLADHPPTWHFDRFVEFTQYKGWVGEPSPHLAIVGHMARDMTTEDRLWLLGCYAATYCLPTAQVIHTLYPLQQVRLAGQAPLEAWLTSHWPGIVTRTERRCVRSPAKMADCLTSLARWVVEDYEPLTHLPPEYSTANYDHVWDSVAKIRYFGRYIAIRFIEGLRRYCGVPAMLYDIRSVGGWSPKRALCYFYPEHTDTLLVDDAAGNALTDRLANEILVRVREQLPEVNEYILAAMLCEYKAYYENRKQYPSWTIDQEPLLYDKVFEYWGDAVDRGTLWEAREALFPECALGEKNGWNGTRWDLTKTLRDHGYVWSDVLYDYGKTNDLTQPERRVHA
jgi:Amino acid:DNA transferase